MSCDCGTELHRSFVQAGVDAHVTTVPPLIQTGYEPLDLTCPHGVTWYAEPTGDQRAGWAQGTIP